MDDVGQEAAEDADLNFVSLNYLREMEIPFAIQLVGYGLPKPEAHLNQYKNTTKIIKTSRS